MKLSANMVIAIEEAPESGQFREDKRTLNALAVRQLAQNPRLLKGVWVSRLTLKGRVTKKNLRGMTNHQMLDIFGDSPRLLEYCK